MYLMFTICVIDGWISRNSWVVRTCLEDKVRISKMHVGCMCLSAAWVEEDMSGWVMPDETYSELIIRSATLYVLFSEQVPESVRSVHDEYRVV
jgi:hypothetical protein